MDVPLSAEGFDFLQAPRRSADTRKSASLGASAGAGKARRGCRRGRPTRASERPSATAERGALTFDALADDYLERYAKPHKRSWANDALYLRAHVRPAWGPRPANRISRADAAALLDTIAKTAPTSANRTQSILSRLFNWAIESGLLEINPLARMPKRAKEKAKDRVLAPEEIRVLWAALESTGLSRRRCASCCLTGLRPGEAAGATIAELADVDNTARARLEIPASRMKGGSAHVVPLAPLALADRAGSNLIGR